MTVLIPKSLSAQTACSLLEPQPKFSLEKTLVAVQVENMPFGRLKTLVSKQSSQSHLLIFFTIIALRMAS